jgi:hypothetical protein
MNQRKIMKQIKRDFPSAIDYNVSEESNTKYAEILGVDDKVMGYVSEGKLTRYFNLAEGE